MKIGKVLALVSVVVLIGCSRGKTPKSSSEQELSSSSFSNESSSLVTSSSISSSSWSRIPIEGTSFTPISIPPKSSSSQNEITPDVTLSFNFYNPTCGTMSTEVLNERLAAYMNEVAGTTFVTSIENTKCQIASGIPTSRSSVLVIGAASSAGSLEFNFSSSIKKVTILAETYHKPYSDPKTGEEVPNIDPNSVCYINDDSTFINLKPNKEEPIEREYSVVMKGKRLKLYTKEDIKSRVLIKSMTFIY